MSSNEDLGQSGESDRPNLKPSDIERMASAVAAARSDDHVEAAQTAPAASPVAARSGGSGSKKWIMVSAGVLVLGAGVVGAAVGLGGSGGGTEQELAGQVAEASDSTDGPAPATTLAASPTPSSAPVTTGAPNTAAPTTAVPTTSVPTTVVPTTLPAEAAPSTDAPESDGAPELPATDEGLASDADELSETARRTLLVALADDGHAGVYRGGRLYLEGRVPDEATSIELETTAAEVIGAENVENNYEIDPSVGQITDGIVIIDEPFLFGKNSAAITAEYNEILDLGVLVMKLNPGATFNVVGHADSNGSLSENQRLSDERAQAVANYLIEREIEPERIVVSGAGDSQPVATNDTEEGRALNRRIEVTLEGLLD